MKDPTQDPSLHARKLRVMHSARESSDKVLTEALEELARSTNQVHSISGRKLKGWNIDSAFNDPALAGGGFKGLYNRLVKMQAFCPNESLVHGKARCGRMIPDHHGQTCSHCGSDIFLQSSDGARSMLNVDFYFRLDEYYKVVFSSTDIAQRIVDYYPTTISHLSSPLDDAQHEVVSTQGGYVARADYRKDPDKFTLDLVPKVGEAAYLDLGPAFNSELEEVTLIGVCESSFIVLRKDGTESTVNKEDVLKISGKIQLNVVTLVDGADVIENLAYANLGTIEVWQNIAREHQRRPEFVPAMGISAGGVKHYNVHERSVFYERQRRRLQRDGTAIGPFTVFMEGRVVRVHSATLYRNEFCCCMDNPEVEASAGVMGQRNPESLSPFLANFHALNTQRRSVYSYLLNQQARPVTEEESAAGFAKAEEARGTTEWEAVCKSTGFKSKTLMWHGSERHNLAPMSDRSTFLRVDHEKYHSQAIVVNLFRSFLISLLPGKRRRVLADQVKLIRQPPGKGD